MLSVIIPLFNKEKTVARALRSVLQQTHQDFEIIVVNDGSTDASIAEVRGFDDRRIRLVHQPNSGVSAARNRGIQEAKSDTVAFLDADDEWKPWFAETVSDLQRDYPEAGVWATNYEFALPGGRRWPTKLNGLPKSDWRGVIPDYFLLAARSHPPVHSSSISAARTAMNSVGGFPVGVQCGEDLLTWARLAAYFPIAYCSKTCSTFWVTSHETSCLSAPSRRPELDDVVGRELRKLEGSLNDAEKRSLCLYIARWKRMRASMFSRCGDIRNTVGSSIRALKLNPLEPVVLGFVALAVLHWSRNFMPKRRAS
jgi:hypothetical protein